MPTAKGVALTLPHPLSALMADQCFGPTAVAWAPTEVRRQPVSRHLVPEFSLWRHLLVLSAAGWREQTGTKMLQRGERRGRGNKFSLHHASVPVPEPEGATLRLPTSWSCWSGERGFGFPCACVIQRSWAGRLGKGSHTRRRTGSVHCSFGARRKEELKTAKSYWNANCCQCTFSSSEILSTSDAVDQMGGY